MSVEVRLGKPRVSWTVLPLIAAGVAFGLGIALRSKPLRLGGAAASVVLIVGVVMLVLARSRRFGADNSAAISALGQGRYDEARTVFTRWAGRGPGTVAANARHNLGWTLLLEGRVGDAVTVLEDAARHHQHALRALSLLPTTRIDAALCHALLGQLEPAEAWIAMARDPAAGIRVASFAGMMALTQAVLTCRRGHAAQAAAGLAQARAEHEPTMTGDTLRMMRVVHAFCAGADSPREQGVVEQILGDLRPRHPREFAFLGGAWPDMHAFLAAHGLGA
ncbi:MAG: tetratricopeptide repeat protein [Kofleriaceae bacterium]|nr:tetratricopeptide repeat protein [Kofleriaceae bacterium]MBP9203466.1 tetratricopeptide repeat protein [Kofleriaceae bacterium]